MFEQKMNMSEPGNVTQHSKGNKKYGRKGISKDKSWFQFY